jgi:acyl-CoA thioester hydrolase
MSKETVDSEIRVRYAETDQMGVAYYANYLVWFEVGRAEFCRQKGFIYADLERMGFRLAVTDAHCHYRYSAYYDECVVIRTRLKELNKRMITFGYQVLRKSGEELLAEGETRHICLDSGNKPKSLPQAFLARLGG